MSDNACLSGLLGSSGGGRVSRRTVLGVVPVVAGGVLLGWAGGGSAARAWLRQSAGSDFPQPQVRRSDAGVLATTLDVRFTPTDIPGFRSVYTRTYEAMIPGPTLRVRPGDRLDLRQVNGLPPNEGGEPANPNIPHHFNSFNLHTHGLHVDPTGIADNIFREFEPAPEPGLPGPVYETSITIPDDHPAGTFWYHPHHHGSVAVQLLGGMAGTLIVEGDIDQVPEIAAARDVVVCINELKLVDGQVPDLTEEDTFRNVASTFLVNGVLNPTITLASGEVARWRLIHAGGFTVLPVTLQGHPLHQIAQDGITFMNPVPQSTVRLAMGGRADVLVLAGSPGTYQLTAAGVSQPLMTMVVTEPLPAPMPLPDTLLGRPPTLPDPSGTRTLTFAVQAGVFSGPFTTAFRILGTGETPPIDPTDPQHDLRWGRFDPDFVNQSLRLGDVEEWTINNTAGHPFHLHTNHFLVTKINGRPLDPPIWHDTISAQGQVVFRVRFDDFTGKTVMHCHHLQHEDEGMMQTIEYIPQNPSP